MSIAGTLMEATINSLDAGWVTFKVPFKPPNLSMQHISLTIPRSAWQKVGSPVKLNIDFIADEGTRLILWGEDAHDS